MLGTIENPSFEQRKTKKAWNKTAMRAKYKAQRKAVRLQRKRTG